MVLPLSRLAPALAVAAALALGCSDDEPAGASSSTGGGTSTSGAGGSPGAGGAGGQGPIGGDRPVEVFVPSSYADGTPTPLVILLHGYGASGNVQEAYFKLQPLAEQRGFLYAHPDGTVDDSGKRFWNATDACCDFKPTNVDDSSYLRGVVDDIKERYTVDPKRVFFLGHSNGGFMTYRMACDHADTIAAIASLAGAMVDDVSKCTASEPVAVLQIHGTADATVAYDGGEVAGHTYPSALQSVQDWATFDGCTAGPSDGPTLDLEADLAGSETTSQIFSGCDPGGHAELWSIAGAGHIPSLSADFAPSVIDFLLAHPKP
jgi:polyhydroxybutyrate depolymerase